MKVLGHEVPQETIDRALQWFAPDTSFTAWDLHRSLERYGCPEDVSYRAADRILQSCRKAGTHFYSGNKWKRSQPAS